MISFSGNFDYAMNLISEFLNLQGVFMQPFKLIIVCNYITSKVP